MQFSFVYIDIEMPLVKMPNEQLKVWIWSSKIIFLLKYNLGVTVEVAAKAMECLGNLRVGRDVQSLTVTFADSS